MYWLLLLLFPIFSGTNGLICKTNAECQNSLPITNSTETSFRDCQIRCEQSQANCQFYTYYQDSQDCLLYINCPTLNYDCSGCATGQPGCPKDICDQTGECLHATIVGAHIEDTYNQCLDICRDNDEFCRYFTHDDMTKDCILYLDCPQFDSNSCSSCKTGQPNCTSQYTCFESGFCVGVSVGHETVDNAQVKI